MKQITTDPGAVYCVYTTTGCTVTDTATGCTLMTAEPGQPNYFAATGHSVTLSDADATCLRPRFKSAPAALRLLGGGDKLPAGYTRVEFLESTGTQAIVLPVNINNAKSWYAGTEVQFTALPAQGTGAQEGNNTQFQWGLWGSESGGASAFMSANNASGNLSLGKVGESWNSWTTLTIGYDAPYHRWGTWGAFSAEDEGSNGPPNVTEFVLFCAKRYGSFAFFQKVRKKWLVLKADGVPLYSLIPALDPTGTPCMFDRVTREPFRNAGSGQFVAGVGTVAQLTALLRNLPATGGSLTLSLPAEANTPEVAEQLQSCHDTKGWTLTVHEYRPAEAATYSLRRVREVVWCRKVQAEYGSYVDSIGTRWQVDRCAAIYGPHGQDPTAYGYAPFDSVEQAAEQWGLTPYIAPDEEQA